MGGVWVSTENDEEPYISFTAEEAALALDRPPASDWQMLRQESTEMRIPTRGRGLCEITGEVRAFLRKAGVRQGLLTLHLRHTSASLLIQENADPEVQRDLERFFTRLAPDGDKLFEHTSEGADDMPAHVRTALTTVNLSIPILDGEPVLGTWQGIYLWEHRHAPHIRQLVMHVVGE